jgi:hypothetical protein
LSGTHDCRHGQSGFRFRRRVLFTHEVGKPVTQHGGGGNAKLFDVHVQSKFPKLRSKQKVKNSNCYTVTHNNLGIHEEIWAELMKIV